MKSRHITTITVNAAIDKTCYVSSLAINKVNRVSRMLAQPGGKGINVARVAHLLGEKVIASGFIGGDSGHYIESELTRQGIQHLFVAIAGQSRVCLNIIDEQTNESTEILEPGASIDEKDLLRLFQKLDHLADTTSVLVLSGSIPNGTSEDLYSRIMERWKLTSTAPVLVDTSGAALFHSLSQSIPYMIKPNEEEMSLLTNHPIDIHNINELARAVRFWNQKGIQIVAVSLGEQGSLVGMNNTIYQVGTAKVEAINTVGCGDAFVAGMAVGLHRGIPEQEMLRLASACGASNSLHQSAGVINPQQVQKFLSSIQVNQLSLDMLE